MLNVAKPCSLFQNQATGLPSESEISSSEPLASSSRFQNSDTCSSSIRFEELKQKRETYELISIFQPYHALSLTSSRRHFYWSLLIRSVHIERKWGGSKLHKTVLITTLTLLSLLLVSWKLDVHVMSKYPHSKDCWNNLWDKAKTGFTNTPSPNKDTTKQRNWISTIASGLFN